MADLGTRYMGLELKNPVLVGSSGLTKTLEGVRRCADAGAGAVVLRSIFEEEIEAAVGQMKGTGFTSVYYLEAEEYLNRYGRDNAVSGYLDLIRGAKQALEIPVIASINCVAAGSWTEFAAQIESAGADALELNMFVLPTDPRRDAKATEQVYFDVARAVCQKVSIPVALKVGPYFSSLSRTLVELSRTGAKGLVLFNRFVRIDFDIDKLEVVPGELFSTPDEMLVPLRWISILSSQVRCDLAATTGVHDAAGVIKHLLAGATAVQLCSAIYRNDPSRVTMILEGLERWMNEHGFESVHDFRGRLSQDRARDPAAFERVQFIKATEGVA